MKVCIKCGGPLPDDYDPEADPQLCDTHYWEAVDEGNAILDGQ